MGSFNTMERPVSGPRRTPLTPPGLKPLVIKWNRNPEVEQTLVEQEDGLEPEVEVIKVSPHYCWRPPYEANKTCRILVTAVTMPHVISDVSSMSLCCTTSAA